MISRLVLFCLLGAVASVSVADVYRWKDEQGNIVFSDTPREGAEKIQLKETTVVPALRPTVKLMPEGEPAPMALPYTTLAIASPANEETVRNTDVVNVSVAIAPPLQVDFGHQLQLYLDGKPRGAPAPQTDFTLEQAERGAHTLAVAILGDDGREITRSPPSTFFLHQAAVKKPAKPPTNKPPKPAAN